MTSARRIKVIVNPAAAGNAAGKKWPLIQRQLTEAGLDFDYELTLHAGHAIVLAREAVAQGYGLVIGIGGDGTVNEVANGLIDEEGIPRATLGMISTGTGSDFARCLNFPKDIGQACCRLANPNEVLVDIGVAEYYDKGKRKRRFFVNAAGLGFDAAVVKNVSKRFRNLGGTATYLAGLFYSLLTYHNKDIILSLDGEEYKRRIVSVVVCNGSHFGGGMKIAPNADMKDGIFDVVVIGDIGKGELVRELPRIYRGTHVDHPKVYVYQAKHIILSSSEDIALEADGELLGEAPVDIRIIPSALPVAL